MSELLTVEIPDDLARQARALAAASNRRLEDFVVDWIERAVAEPPVESLTDEQLLAECDGSLANPNQEELSALLSAARENELTPAERERLDRLMAQYRRGLIRKAQALREAVARGLKPPLSGDAA